MSDKPALARDNTMAVTAKIGNQLLGGQKLGDTRNNTAQVNKAKKSSLQRANTAAQVAAEAKAFLGKDVNVSGGRVLRARPAKPKPPVKRAGTMKNTAKEGKAFLKRKTPKKAAAAPEATNGEEASS